MSEPRTFWTSGRDPIDAMNVMGKERPICGSADVAYKYAIAGDSLYRITVEEFSLDNQDVMTAYLKALDPQKEPAND